MNVDLVLETFGRHDTAFLLVGGMNYLLRHEPVVTFDIDFWIEDTQENRERCEQALSELGCEWGSGDDDWSPVATRPAGWLDQQSVYCLHSPHGAIDIFRSMLGLDSWEDSRRRSIPERTALGTPYRGICDEDMLACQQALAPGVQRQDRMRVLDRAIRDRERKT